MNTNEKAAPRELVFTLPTVAAGTGATFSVFSPSFSGEVVKISISDHAGLNASATSYTTIALVDNTGTTYTMASITSSTTTLTQDTLKSFTLSATKANRRFASGDAIVLVKTDTGGGGAMTTPTIQVEFVSGTYDS